MQIKNKFFLFLSAALLLISCGKKEEKKEAAILAYEMKSFRIESAGGCQGDTTSCASYEIEYPEFNSLSKHAADSLMLRIAASVDTGNPEIDTLSMQVAGKKFIADFEATKKEFPESALGWFYKASVSVNVISDTLISLEANTEYFTGGAHGGYGTYFINIKPTTGETLKLSHVLKPGFEEPLTTIAESEFRKSLEATDTISFEEKGFEFPDDQFTLNDNYGFTKDGIVFVFNTYEIGPYVLGATEVLIPYNKIQDLLKR